MNFKCKGDKALYSFIDAKCIGRTCWAAGMYQHRSPLSGGGSRNTGSPDWPCCLTRAYRGCPEGPDGHSVEICPECKGARVFETAPAGAIYEDDLAEYAACHVCYGHGEIIHVGVRAYDPYIAAERKAEGWKKA
jgi:hypothetical protein